MDQADDHLINLDELDPLAAFSSHLNPPPTQNPTPRYTGHVAPAAAGRSAALPGSEFGLAAGEVRSQSTAGRGGVRDMASLAGMFQDLSDGGSMIETEFLEPFTSTASPSAIRDQVRFWSRPEESERRGMGVPPQVYPSTPVQPPRAQASNEVVLAQALTQIVGQLQRMQSASPAVKVVCRAQFTGEETEDPRLFLLELRRFFARGHIDDPIEQTHQALERLQGRAASFGRNFRIFPIPFPEFARRLLETFDNIESQVKVRAQFYGQKQSSGEAAGSFIARKRALSARMTFRDQLEEETIVSTIITQLLPELRSRLRFAGITSMEALVGAAITLEEDLAEERRMRGPPSATRPPAGGPTNRAIQENPRNPQNRFQGSPRQPPRDVENTRNRQERQRHPAGCFVCGGPHMARDCRQTPRAIMPPSQRQVNALREEASAQPRGQRAHSPKNVQRAGDAQNPSARSPQTQQ